jgi:hypothetical protein
MFWIDFYRAGISAGVMLPVGQSFDKNFFAGTVLPSIVVDRALSRPKLKTSGTYDTFGIKKLPHPLCSPELAQRDCWRLEYLKHCLEGHFFDDDIALEGAMSVILLSIEHEMLVRLFVEWKNRLRQSIGQRGDNL